MKFLMLLSICFIGFFCDYLFASSRYNFEQIKLNKKSWQFALVYVNDMPCWMRVPCKAFKPSFTRTAEHSKRDETYSAQSMSPYQYMQESKQD
jgi:hypothetical protein